VSDPGRKAGYRRYTADAREHLMVDYSREAALGLDVEYRQSSAPTSCKLYLCCKNRPHSPMASDHRMHGAPTGGDEQNIAPQTSLCPVF
jgi:hypothetical protein